MNKYSRLHNALYASVYTVFRYACIALLLSIYINCVYAYPIFDYDILCTATNSPSDYTWQLTINNLSSGNSADDSGTSLTVYTGNSSGHDYDGGSIGDYWDAGTTTSDNNKFTAVPYDSSGNITPLGLDPQADTLIINFHSPYNTLVTNQQIVVNTYGYDRGAPGYSTPYSINAHLPGVVPEPTTVITNIIGAVTTTYETVEYMIYGTNNDAVVGMMIWTNHLSGSYGNLSATPNWHFTVTNLFVGTNVISVFGSNSVGHVSTSSVSNIRLGAGTGTPVLDITNASASVAYAVTNYTIGGTNNVHVVGTMMWTNLLTGGSGALPATTTWVIANIVLQTGTNIVIVYGTNILSVYVSDTVTVTRAMAGVTWAVSEPTISIGDYDPGHPGNESIFEYLVQNTSSAGDANNMIDFTLAGTANLQVYDAEMPSGWTYVSMGNSITFNGNGSYIPPANQDTFKLYSYNTSSAQGTANATSEGDPTPLQFPQLNTTIPSSIPEPTTSTIYNISILNEVCCIGIGNMTANITNSIERSFDLMSNGWMAVTDVVVTGTATNWCEAVQSGWTSVYYRVISVK